MEKSIKNTNITKTNENKSIKENTDRFLDMDINVEVEYVFEFGESDSVRFTLLPSEDSEIKEEVFYDDNDGTTEVG